MNFTHLYIETNYSMNGSNIKIEDLVNKAVVNNYSSLAITDNRMYGVIKFYKECHKNNIKPIIGLSVFIEGIKEDYKSKVLLYAKNNEGYKNLLELSSFYALNGVITLSELKAYNNGIITVIITDESELITYYKNNQINELNEFKEMCENTFKEYYINISANDDFNTDFHKEYNFILVPKVSFFNEDDFIIYSTLKKIFNLEASDFLGKNGDNHFLTKEEVKAKYPAYIKELEKTDLIMKSCDVTIDFDTIHLPKYKLKNNVSSKDYLHALAVKGLEKRLKGQNVNKKEYIDRLRYELKVIDDMGYNDYFLIVWDFVKYAKKNKYLVGPGRGSAAASLVSYCLGITAVDSIKYDLVFERFLNPERITLPDIDMDLPDDKRDEIIKYVRDLYGINKVASICTFGTFQSKSAIRDTARVLEVDGVIINQIMKETDRSSTIKEMIENSPVIQNIMNQNNQAKNLLEIAAQIEGLHRHVSTHAAGILVTEGNLVENTPVQSGLLNMMQTQYEGKDLEDLGLLKIDFLGLRNLTSIDKIVTMINEKENLNLDTYKIPLDDKKTFDLLKRVETTGIFQLESQGMRSLIGQMQIDNFEDIVTILALFRPGPMENIPSYIRRRFGKEKVTYPHKILEEILKPTNGIIIYQEQIIKIASNFAGYSLGEADLLRRAVSKKQGDILEKERNNFVSKATQRNHDEKTSNIIYDYIVKFANYGFNRAHSVAYAVVSYWMAYLKANYPKYFISVLTSSVIGSESQMRNYIFESNKLGVKVLRPSVNKSTAYFNPEGEDLRYPLLGIKNLGRNTVKSLLDERANGDFESYFDFITRTNSFLNKRVLESLINAGALDDFNYSKRTMIENLEEVISFSQYGSFIGKDQFVLENVAEYEYSDLEEREKQVLGFNLFMNPLIEFTDYINKHKLKKPSNVIEEDIGKETRVIGVLSYIKKIKTKNGKEMAFITIQDEYTKLNAVLFTSIYLENKDNLFKNKVYLFKGRPEIRNNEIQLIADNIHLMER